MDYIPNKTVQTDNFQDSRNSSKLKTSSSSCHRRETKQKGTRDKDMDDQKVEGKMDDLLEECWFFENLLLRKTRYSRSNSDPFDDASLSTSNQVEYAPSVSEVYAEIIKQENLTEQKTSEGIVHDMSINKDKNGQHLMRANRGLSRAPSLPTKMGIELKESSEECVPHMVSKLSRQQTSLTPNHLQPRKGNTKGNFFRTESLNLEAINEMRNGYVKYQKNTRKADKTLKCEELQGFKDLGFKFDNLVLSPDATSILPGLQENKAMSNIDEEVQVQNENRKEDTDNVHCHKFDASKRSPYISEEWQLQRSSSSISNWVERKSSEDIKAQLRSWARTVASNAR